jgi:hypothetical protein
MNRSVRRIRPATHEDVERLLDLAARKRTQYESYVPRFHRPAPDARTRQQPYFHHLIDSSEVIVLVHEAAGTVDAFITGQLFPPPPVYDPGGPGCLVDDFCVEDAELWPTVGRALLEELRLQAKDLGAVQVIVVCGPRDLPKRDMLGSAGLAVVSEWLVGET